MPTMSKGKFDTRVTIRSSVLIWAAESSSTVAVYEWREVIIDLWFTSRSREQVCTKMRSSPH